MEKLIIFLMGITIAVIAIKWRLAVNKNKKSAAQHKAGGAGASEVESEKKTEGNRNT